MEVKIIKCPHCGKLKKQKLIKSWTYGRMFKSITKKGIKFGASIKCSRYQCECGKPFNHFSSPKGKSWTIPKMKK